MRSDHESGKLPYVGVGKKRDGYRCMTAPFSLRHLIVPMSSYPSVRTRLYCPILGRDHLWRLIRLTARSHERSHYLHGSAVRCCTRTTKLDTAASLHYFRELLDVEKTNAKRFCMDLAQHKILHCIWDAVTVDGWVGLSSPVPASRHQWPSYQPRVSFQGWLAESTISLRMGAVFHSRRRSRRKQN